MPNEEIVVALTVTGVIALDPDANVIVDCLNGLGAPFTLADTLYIVLPYKDFTTFSEDVELLLLITTLIQLLSNISKFDAVIACPVIPLNNVIVPWLSSLVSLSRIKLYTSSIDPLLIDKIL